MRSSKILREFKDRISSHAQEGQRDDHADRCSPNRLLEEPAQCDQERHQQFVDNIWTHLKAGFMAWLFGSLAELAIEIPIGLLARLHPETGAASPRPDLRPYPRQGRQAHR